MLIDALKGLFNTLIILLVGISAFYVLRKRNCFRTSLVLLAGMILFFLLASTNYLPRYFVSRLELKYPTFDPAILPAQNKVIRIFVLGGGYVHDESLPAVAQLSYPTLCRLTEAIRINQLIDSSQIICSGYIASGTRSLASTVQAAAIELGVDSSRLIVMDGTHSTSDEAISFTEIYGKDAPVIVVTDAMHMPRAMKFFTDKGLKAYAAPTNFLIKTDSVQFGPKWIPSVENIQLTDRLIREILGLLKGMIYN